MSDSLSRIQENSQHSQMTRRRFFRRAGLGAATATLVISGCDSEDPTVDPQAVVLDFSDDFGVLNYAFALEQLEAAFYNAVIQGSYYQSLSSGSEERQILLDIRDHEVAHVAFIDTPIEVRNLPT